MYYNDRYKYRYYLRGGRIMKRLFKCSICVSVFVKEKMRSGL